MRVTVGVRCFSWIVWLVGWRGCLVGFGGCWSVFGELCFGVRGIGCRFLVMFVSVDVSVSIDVVFGIRILGIIFIRLVHN